MRIETTFPLGRIVATTNAIEALTNEEILGALARHAARDWGDLCGEDRRLNDEAVDTGGRLLSAYLSAGGRKFWIITEHDRSATTVLLPGDY